MKLYITPGSPYARVARIVVLEKRLEGRVEFVVAQTRSADSPYYRIAASGRVPYLVRDDGVGLEESSVICRYLDHLDGKPAFDVSMDDAEWEALRLGALATSLMDGLSVWLRDLGCSGALKRTSTATLHRSVGARANNSGSLAPAAVQVAWQTTMHQRALA